MHTDFIDAYWKVRHLVNNGIHAHGSHTKHLSFMGHSLGAALATIAAIDQGYATGPATCPSLRRAGRLYVWRPTGWQRPFQEIV
jgi:hypothetical protein